MTLKFYDGVWYEKATTLTATATTPYTVASLAAGAIDGPHTTTVNGARVGDQIAMTLSVNQLGVTFTGQVSATNVVTWWARNDFGGGPVSLSGTLNIITNL